MRLQDYSVIALTCCEGLINEDEGRAGLEKVNS